MDVEITREFLASKLRYDPETGLFWWLTARGKWPDAKPAGQRDTQGYIRIWIAGRKRRAHQLAWLYVVGELPTLDIDHVDGDRGNNRIGNLRLATVPQNLANSGLRKNNTSGFKGVYSHGKSGKWTSYLAGRYLGIFATKEEAHDIYLRESVRLYGEFVRMPPGAREVIEAAR